MENAFKGFEGLVFPIYRKHRLGNALVRIDTPSSFIEIQRIGDKYWQHTIDAQAYPEKVLIHDMIHLIHPLWEESVETEFITWSEHLN